MTEKFERAIEKVLKHEGGYVNDPNDAGRETKYGISKRSYPDLDIKNLSLQEAKSIYYKDFWIPGKFKNIQSEEIATKLFDLSVNMGSKQAIKLIQRALRCVGFIYVEEDGILGKVTLASINTTNPEPLLYALKSEAAGFYRLLAANKPSQSKFLLGWLNRAYA